jgi:hypothetical protein
MCDINMSDINMPGTDTDGVTPHEIEVDEIPVVDNVNSDKTPQEDEPDDTSDLPEVRRAKVDFKDRYLALHLPPMHTLEEIFNDLAAKALSLGFGEVVKRLESRPLRIATVCSGTESPILAMEMFLKGELFFLVRSHLCLLTPDSTRVLAGLSGLGGSAQNPEPRPACLIWPASWFLPFLLVHNIFVSNLHLPCLDIADRNLRSQDWAQTRELHSHTSSVVRLFRSNKHTSNGTSSPPFCSVICWN